ncbi:MAG: hypothetical protein RI894_888, partial [Bacteroidota bacterium]
MAFNYETYIAKLQEEQQSNIGTEHSPRAHLKYYLEALLPDYLATNEPKLTVVGRPDFIVRDKQRQLPLAYLETKDIGKNLDSALHEEQFERYKRGLNLLFITDYMEFRLYAGGVLTETVRIAELHKGEIQPLPENKEVFEALIRDLPNRAKHAVSITSPEDLAERMAAKAKIFADVIHKALQQNDSEFDIAEGSLRSQFTTFKVALLPDLDFLEFSDLYAQTVAFGLFAARLHDPTLHNFSREEAATLVPHSNPFLRKLFNYIASNDLDRRIIWIIDDLVATFLASDDVKTLLKNFGYGEKTRQEDPIIHFYETFLAAYNPDLRKARGVWYTPQPVVNFIVRAVDDLLKSDFGIPKGIADDTKIAIERRNLETGKLETVETHRVQVLDPACGSGTFLAEIFTHIHQRFVTQKGLWNAYIEKSLVPRMHGFELLMAPYVMAHIKLERLLHETGYKPSKQAEKDPNISRMNIFLTNALEPQHKDTGTLFVKWLSDEANGANRVKNDIPVMIVMGNPPYAGHSANRTKTINDTLEPYKKEPSGGKLKEHNAKWLNDDYVKFMRMGEGLIIKNKTGILAFINPHGYLDNPTFRGMRYHLLQTFDTIYTIDLHGNSKKKETTADGSPDVNVFDIMQGVSINIFVKNNTKKKGELATVFHADLYGKREFKYDFLLENSLKTVDFAKLPMLAPNYFFVPKDFAEKAIYDEGFSIKDLFILNSVGITTARDAFTIHQDPDELTDTITKFMGMTDEAARDKFNLGADVRDWQVALARKDLQTSKLDFEKNVIPIEYRPFDTRYTYYTGKSKGFHCMPRGEVMQHFLKGENIGLIIPKQVPDSEVAGGFITRNICGHKTYSAYNVNNVFPLYCYKETNTFGKFIAIPNLDTAIAEKIAASIGCIYDENAGLNDTGYGEKRLTPRDILDYIYAVLHTPTYRETYKE